MMALFPGFLQILLPNWNFMTAIGVLAILISIAVFALGYFTGLLAFTFRWAMTFFIAGAVLIVTGSVLEDLVSTSGGAVIVFGSVLLLVFGFALFYEPNRTTRRRSKK